MKYRRLVLSTLHGYNGKEMDVGESFGNHTEYDIEAAVAAIVAADIQAEGIRVEYWPKTARQYCDVDPWKHDLRVSIGVNFKQRDTKIRGTYVHAVGEAFPRYNWIGEGPVVIILGKGPALQSASVIARDLVRDLAKLFGY